MLNDAEQRTLARIETGLQQDDPAFVARFDRACTAARRPRLLGMTAGLWLLAFVVGALLAWLYESAALSVVAMSALGIAVSLWSLSAESGATRAPDPRAPDR